MILRAAAAVFVKDLRSEWRTRVALNALLLFAFSVLILVGYAVGPTRLALEDRPVVNSVLLWIVLFFSAMTGLSAGLRERGGDRDRLGPPPLGPPRGRLPREAPRRTSPSSPSSWRSSSRSSSP